MSTIGIWFGATAKTQFIRRNNIAADELIGISRLCSMMTGTAYSSKEYWIDGYLNFATLSKSNVHTGAVINERLVAEPFADTSVFMGWYAVRASGNEYNVADFSRLVTVDKTLMMDDLEALGDLKIGATNNLPTYYVLARYAAACTVTFNSNTPAGATVTLSEPMRIVGAGSVLGQLPTATCDKGSFVGWYTSAVGGTKVLADTVVSSDVTYYAHWAAQVGVMLDAAGGILADFYRNIGFGEQYGTLPVPTKPGCTFIGWYTAPVGGTQVLDSTVVTTMDDHVLYARWSKDAVMMTVHFVGCGGTLSGAAKTVTSGEAYGSLPIPTRSGYTFMGWFTASLGGDLVTADTAVGRTYTHWLYAQWTEIVSSDPDEEEFGVVIGRIELKKGETYEE